MMQDGNEFRVPHLRGNDTEFVDCADLPRHKWNWPNCVERNCSELQALVIDDKRKLVLLERDNDQWILPGCLIDREHYASNVEPWYLIHVFQRILGLECGLVFRRVSWTEEKTVVIENERLTTFLEKSVVFLEYQGDASTAYNKYEWVRLQETEIYHQFDAGATAIQDEMELALSVSEPKNRCSWQRRCWYRNSTEWMEKILQRVCKASLEEPIKHLRSSVLSSILEARTSNGKYFLKCTSPVTNDVSYTKTLAHIAPNYVAKPLAVDEKRQMMVTSDYGEILTSMCFSKEERTRLSTDYLQLQKATIGKSDELIKAGFPDFRPMTIMDCIDEIVSEPRFTALLESELDFGEGPVAAEVRFFIDNTARFKARLQILIDSSMPDVVHHNDLYLSNVYKPRSSDGYMFFDWVEGFLSHPFIGDLNGIYDDIIFKEWVDYGTKEQLQEVYDVGRDFYKFVITVLRFREAWRWEEPDASESLESALQELEWFNERFRS